MIQYISEQQCSYFAAPKQGRVSGKGVDIDATDLEQQFCGIGNVQLRTGSLVFASAALFKVRQKC